MQRDRIILLSRLKIHGKVLFTALDEMCPTSWIGKEFASRINTLTFPFLLLRELISLFKVYRNTKSRSPVVLVHFISLDAIPAFIFRFLTGSRVVLYSIGQDALGELGRFQRTFLTWAVRSADAVVCVNRPIQQRIASISSVTPEILPTPFVKTTSSGDEQKEFDFVTVGALTPIKMQDLLIRSCAHLERPVRIAIIGDGPLRNTLSDLAKRFSGHEISFLGQLPHDQVYSVLRRSRIYVSCSRYEGVPSAILEAIWNGLPVVSSPGGYAIDMINLYDFRLFLADDFTPFSLASTLNFALKNLDQVLLDSGRNKGALERYTESWTSTAKKTICSAPVPEIVPKRSFSYG